MKHVNEITEPCKYPGIDVVTTTVDEKTYRSAIHYPKFTAEALNSEINIYVANMKLRFFNELFQYDERQLKKRPASFYITFDIYPVADHIYSVVFKKESYFGEGNPEESANIFIVDIENGQLIKQTEIIHDTEENKEELYKLLREAFERSIYSPYFDEEKFNEWFHQDDVFSNMYAREESIEYIFEKDEVTAEAAGMPLISLPYNKVKGILSEEWLELLKIHVDPDDSEDPNINPIQEQDQDSTPLPAPTPEPNSSGEPNPSPALPGENPNDDVSENTRVVALTFDDGPHPVNTIQILELLERYDAKATFFMLGSRVKFYPDVAVQIAAAGHELGNHSWGHKDLTVLDREGILQEVQNTNEIIEKVTGHKPTVFRAPYGAINDHVKSLVQMSSIMWTVDTLDWQSRDPQKVLENVKQNVKDGSIILMHDIHATTVEAVELVLGYLQEEGYEFVTISDLALQAEP